jgi:hypothetical protein
MNNFHLSIKAYEPSLMLNYEYPSVLSFIHIHHYCNTIRRRNSHIVCDTYSDLWQYCRILCQFIFRNKLDINQSQTNLFI